MGGWVVGWVGGWKEWVLGIGYQYWFNGMGEGKQIAKRTTSTFALSDSLQGAGAGWMLSPLDDRGRINGWVGGWLGGWLDGWVVE